MSDQIKCPCGRPKNYDVCCGKIHQGIVPAYTAEDLMRSRYTAFVLGDVDYLMKSHHHLKRNECDKEDIKTWAKSVKWLGLEIINKSNGEAKDVFGTVEFKAHFKERFIRTKIHETSKFIKENGVWVYYDALTDEE